MALSLVRKWQVDVNYWSPAMRTDSPYWSTNSKIDVIDSGGMIEFYKKLRISREDFLKIAELIQKNDL